VICWFTDTVRIGLKTGDSRASHCPFSEAVIGFAIRWLMGIDHSSTISACHSA
jgi:hypothetical protein